MSDTPTHCPHGTYLVEDHCLTCDPPLLGSQCPASYGATARCTKPPGHTGLHADGEQVWGMVTNNLDLADRQVGITDEQIDQDVRDVIAAGIRRATSFEIDAIQTALNLAWAAARGQTTRWNDEHIDIVARADDQLRAIRLAQR